MNLVERTRLKERRQAKIHPGWLARPRTGVEILAVMLGVAVPALIQGFEESLNKLVEDTLVHRSAMNTKRYLDRLQEQDRRELIAAAAEQDLIRDSSRSLESPESWQNASLRVLGKQGGFANFLDWYNTDDWGQDEWFGLLASQEPEDVRLQRWIDTIQSYVEDQEDPANYFFLDADYFESSEPTPSS